MEDRATYKLEKKHLLIRVLRRLARCVLKK